MKKTKVNVKLSVIIPVYNEKNTVLKILERVKKIPEVYELVVIEDGSTDGTREILEKVRDHQIRILYNRGNLGKGSSVLKGVAEAKGNFVVIQDGDLEYDPGDYKKLLQPVLENQAKIVYGSRFLKNKNLKMVWWIYLGNRFLTAATNVLFGSQLTDMTTCYKLIHKEILDKLNLSSKRFEIDLELTAAFLKKGYKIVEVPITYNGRNYQEGKKITWLDGVRDIILLFRYRFLDSF